MLDLLIGSITAFWLGILTAISPCPLTTNIVAISFIGRKTTNRRMLFLSGLVYTVGRALTYIVLSAIIVTSLISTPTISHVLQKYINKLLGPILIVTGMFLVDLLQFGGGNAGISESAQKRVESMGIAGAGLLGILLALSFCPLSATLFFVQLTSLAIKYNSRILLAAMFGIGTALPVIAFAFLMAVSADAVGKAFDAVKKTERWVRLATGWLIIVIGIYLTLVHIYGL